MLIRGFWSACRKYKREKRSNDRSSSSSTSQARAETSGTCPACHAGAARPGCACLRLPARRLMARISAPASIASTSVAAARSTTSRTSSRRTIASTTGRSHLRGRSSRLASPFRATASRSTLRDRSRQTRGNQRRLLKPRQVDVAIANEAARVSEMSSVTAWNC